MVAVQILVGLGLLALLLAVAFSVCWLVGLAVFRLVDGYWTWDSSEHAWFGFVLIVLSVGLIALGHTIGGLVLP